MPEAEMVPALQPPQPVRFARLRALLNHPMTGLVVIYLVGVGLRLNYSLRVQPPETMIYSDMNFYVELAKRLATSDAPLATWDVTHPLGYPAFLAFVRGADGSLALAGHIHLFVSCLVPLAIGLLGWVAFGRRTGGIAMAFASLYFPFIEFGAYFLSEIHFIFWLALAFAAFFAARDSARPRVSFALAAVGGLTLSIAIALKSVALPAALAFFAADALGLFLARGPDNQASWRARLKPWLMRGALAAATAAPLLVVLARVCTRANGGKFCVTGNKVGADFLLGHYGRIADIFWAADQGHGFGFGSPSSYLRHYDFHANVPFPITDSAANAHEAWKWIFANPFQAFVISLDHLWDTFFGYTLWPTFNGPRWMFAHLSQYVFVLFLFVPTVLVCAKVVRGGWRAALTSRTALVLAPIAALAFTVAVATGEVRYRIPFDIFFIVVTAALATGDVARDAGPHARSPENMRGSSVAESAILS